MKLSAMASPQQTTLDPVTFEVLRSLFEYACARMSQILQKTSFSPILYDMVDFSNAVYDADMRLLGQTANCPVHLAAMQFSARAAGNRFPLESLKEGDVIVLNDPYEGGTHLNDITFTMPIFYRGRILGFAVSRGHWTDLGGGAAGGQAFGTHIAAEGLRLPPIKLFENYTINEDFRRIIMNNTRTPQYVEGDIQAHLGALRAAEAELQRAADRYGEETVRLAMQEVIAYTERMTRKAIAEIPDGVYEGTDYADTDGFSDEPIRIKVKLIVKGEEIIVDFAGTDPVVTGAINSPMANTYSAVYYSLKFFLNPEAPANGGMFAPIKVILPDNCWLNAKWPAPTIACTTLTASKITSAIWQALAKAIPQRATASTFAECNWFVCAVKEPTSGYLSVFSDLPAGGWGGTPYADGMSVTQDPLGNCMNLPAETAELLFPIVYEAFDLRSDSAGPGKHRGGLGARLQIRFLGDAELSMETSRTREGSPGVGGGLRSPVQRLIKLDPQGKKSAIGGWTENGEWRKCLLAAYRFAPGETFVFESTGGGGWGNPLEREVVKVLDDVLDDYISIETARDMYGVVVDPKTLKLDPVATQALRMKKRQANGNGAVQPEGNKVIEVSAITEQPAER
jgi:N-methylhydantoinase B/oxoprolinase/acetone carboxylase alpha subunit